MEAPVVLLYGSGRLGVAIEQRLVLAGCQVTKLRPSNDDSLELSEIALQSASVLVLAADDDAGNVDLALTARRLRPDLPLVVRLFDEALVAYLKDTLARVSILSMSAIAAPAFAEATLQAIANRGADRAAAPPYAVKQRVSARRRVGLDRVLLGAMIGLVAVILTSTVFFAKALDLSAIDALYFVWTTVTTVGYGDITLRNASGGVKIVGMMLMFAGAAFIAVLFGLFSDWVVGRRLDVLRGRVRVRGSGHVVIAGGGNIGFRVAGLLREKGHRVVIMERDAASKNVEALRSTGHHVIIADAANNDTLSLANVEDAAVVLALTDSDAVNLHVALLVRARSSGIPVIMRLVSGELSAHVSERSDAVAISPIAVAVEEFARTALLACGRVAPAADGVD